MVAFFLAACVDNYTGFDSVVSVISKSYGPGQTGKEGAKMIQFMKHYVTDGQTKARVRYSNGTLVDGRECVTVYEKNYRTDLHKIFSSAVNNSDGITDYFEKSRVRFFQDDQHYAAALARCN